jgi:serine/threonine protein kinase
VSDWKDRLKETRENRNNDSITEEEFQRIKSEILNEMQATGDWTMVFGQINEMALEGLLTSEEVNAINANVVQSIQSNYQQPVSQTSPPPAVTTPPVEQQEQHLPSNAPKQIGSYEIVGFIGVGGMGTVYRARHRINSMREKQGGDVAIKLLHPQYLNNPEFIERFELEGSKGMRLDHQGIVKTLEVILDGDQRALVMELIQGRSLSDMIGQETGPIPWDQASPLFQQILSAIGYAHTKKIVHRDIKPENIMVTLDGFVKVLDFGIAKDLDASKTKAGTGMGSVNYMAPEQFIDASKVDHRADIYALGTTLYEMVAGRLPWESNITEFNIMQKKVSGELPNPTDFYPYIPEHVVTSINHALKDKVNERLPSVAFFQEALEFDPDASFTPINVSDVKGAAAPSKLDSLKPKIEALKTKTLEFFGKVQEQFKKDPKPFIGVGAVLVLIPLIIFLWPSSVNLKISLEDLPDDIALKLLVDGEEGEQEGQFYIFEGIGIEKDIEIKMTGKKECHLLKDSIFISEDEAEDLKLEEEETEIEGEIQRTIPWICKLDGYLNSSFVKVAALPEDSKRRLPLINEILQLMKPENETKIESVIDISSDMNATDLSAAVSSKENTLFLFSGEIYVFHQAITIDAVKNSVFVATEKTQIQNIDGDALLRVTNSENISLHGLTLVHNQDDTSGYRTVHTDYNGPKIKKPRVNKSNIVEVESSNKIQFIDSEITGSGFHCFNVKSSTDISIEESAVHNCIAEAIYVTEDSKLNIINSVIFNSGNKKFSLSFTEKYGYYFDSYAKSYWRKKKGGGLSYRTAIHVDKTSELTFDKVSLVRKTGSKSAVAFDIKGQLSILNSLIAHNNTFSKKSTGTITTENSCLSGKLKAHKKGVVVRNGKTSTEQSLEFITPEYEFAFQNEVLGRPVACEGFGSTITKEIIIRTDG